jgi:deoxyadenosine/deoxycytidine kinase
MSKRIISILGNIGVGKTTFVKHLKEKVPNAIYLKEPVDQWLEMKDNKGINILDKFYQDTPRWSYTLQNISFITRLALIKDALAKPNTEIVMDGAIATDKNVYAEMLYEDGCLDSLEMNWHNIWCHFYESQLPKDDMFYVYLRADPLLVKQRIIKRGRPEEKNISIEYLTRLHQQYEKWFMNNVSTKVLIVDFSCEEDSPEYQQILQKIVQILIH